MAAEPLTKRALWVDDEPWKDAYIKGLEKYCGELETAIMMALDEIDPLTHPHVVKVLTCTK